MPNILSSTRLNIFIFISRLLALSSGFIFDLSNSSLIRLFQDAYYFRVSKLFRDLEFCDDKIIIITIFLSIHIFLFNFVLAETVLFF